MNEVQPLKETLNAVLCTMLDALDECATLALDEKTRNEITGLEIKLGQIISRAQLILAFLDTHKPPQKPLRGKCHETNDPKA